MMTRWIIFERITAFCLFFSLFLINTNGLSQGDSWSPPQPLSPKTQSNWFPDITVDAAGGIHVAWSGGISVGVGQAYDVVYYTTSRDGQMWTTPKDIIALPSLGAVTRPALLATLDGILHITFRDFKVYYWHAPIGLVQPNKLSKFRMSSGIQNAYFSYLAADSQNRLHVIFTENSQNPGCPDCFHIFHRLSQDGGISWSPPVDVTPLLNGAGKPQLVIDKQDTLHVIWEAGLGGDLGQVPDPTTIRYSRSSDLGKTWSDFYEFPAPGGRARNPTLGLGKDGQLVAAYLGLPEDTVYYQVSQNGGISWSDPKPIPGVLGGWSYYPGRTDGYSMASDSRGDVHLALVGRIDEGQITPEPTPEIVAGEAPTQTATIEAEPTPTLEGKTLCVLHLVWDGDRWSQPETVVSMVGDVPEWPRIAVGLGNRLHVVWFVRDEAEIWISEIATSYRIWYSQKVTNAPAYTPVAPQNQEIALSPTPKVETTTEALPNPTATPTMSTVTSGVISDNLVYSEQGYLQVIAFSMVPVFFFIAIVIIIQRIRSLK